MRRCLPKPVILRFTLWTFCIDWNCDVTLTVNNQISISFCLSAVCRDFAVLEDHCLAHNLQEQESKSFHYLYFFNLNDRYYMDGYDLWSWSCLLSLNESFEAFMGFPILLRENATLITVELAIFPFCCNVGFTPSPQITFHYMYFISTCMWERC